MQMCGPRSDPIQMRQLVATKGSEIFYPLGATVSLPNCQLTNNVFALHRTRGADVILWQYSQYYQIWSSGWCFTSISTGVVQASPATNLQSRSQRVTTDQHVRLHTLFLCKKRPLRRGYNELSSQ